MAHDAEQVLGIEMLGLGCKNLRIEPLRLAEPALLMSADRALKHLLQAGMP